MDFSRFALVLLAGTALASPALADPIGDVFVIDMENHNFTDPNPNGTVTTVGGVNTLNAPIGSPNTTQPAPAQLFGNAAAPYLNSLITKGNANAAQTAFATNYTSVLRNQNQSVHPSEPNYLWQEAGTNFPSVNAGNSPPGIRNDSSVATNAPLINKNPVATLSGLLQQKGISWTSYQEDTQLQTTGGLNATAGNHVTNGGINGSGNNVTGNLVNASQYTVPLVSMSGTSANYTNSYNGGHQFDFATKHDGQLFFDATNGITAADRQVGNGGVTTNAAGTGTQDLANKEIGHYKPLTKSSFQQDLDSNAVSRYNLITPNQFNDMHTALSGGFTYNGTHFTGDQAAIAQGDNFLSQIIPQIMASQAYKSHGAIVVWFDESEATAVLDAGGKVVASNPDNTGTTIAEIVISPDAIGNAFSSNVAFNHDSDLLTMEEIFGIDPDAIPRDPRDTGPVNDLSPLFRDGAIPTPEPASGLLLAPALLGLGMLHRRRKAQARTA